MECNVGGAVQQRTVRRRQIAPDANRGGPEPTRIAADSKGARAQVWPNGVAYAVQSRRLKPGTPLHTVRQLCDGIHAS